MNEQSRYLRQLLLPQIGPEGQEAFRTSKLLCIGAGGLGSPALFYLAAAGVGSLGIVDPDTVSLSNLQRQILFETSEQGQGKAKLAKEKLKALNPEVEIKTYPFALDANNVGELLQAYDLVLDCSDNFQTKLLLNEECLRQGKPFIYASLSRLEGRLSTFWGDLGPCYSCLYPKKPESQIYASSTPPVLGATAGIIGSLQAMETLKVLLRLKCGADFLKEKRLKTLIGKLLIVETGAMDFQTLILEKNPHCPTCGR